MKPSSPASTICRQRPVRPPRRDSADVKAPSRWGRHLFHSEGLRRLLCWVIQLYIRFVYRTNRWSVEGGDIPVRLRQHGRPFILAFWHGRLLMIPMAWQRRSEEHTSELQSQSNLVCRLLLEKKKNRAIFHFLSHGTEFDPFPI